MHTHFLYYFVINDIQFSGMTQVLNKLSGCKPIWSISPYAHVILTIAVNIYLQELLVSFAVSSGYTVPYDP